MNNQSKTYVELIKEISCLNQRIRKLEQSESDSKRMEEELRNRGEAERLVREMATMADIGRLNRLDVGDRRGVRTVCRRGQ
jgi:hypothetical protein